MEPTPQAPQKTSMPLQIGLMLAAVALLVGLSFFSMKGNQPKAQTGGDFPQMQLLSLDGKGVSLERGKPTVVTVFATWCGYCRQQLPQFEAVAGKRPDIQFAFVNDGESPNLVRGYQDEFAFKNATIYQDMLRQMGTSLKVNGYPSNFFYSSQGKLVGEVRGYMSKEQLEAALVQLN